MTTCIKKKITLGDYVNGMPVATPVEEGPKVKAILKREASVAVQEPIKSEAVLDEGFFDLNALPYEVSPSHYYEVDGRVLPTDFPNTMMPYYEDAMNAYKTHRALRATHEVLTKSWAYEMRKRIEANESESLTLKKLFAIHRRTFNSTYHVLWKTYRRKDLKRLDRDHLEATYKDLLHTIQDPKGHMMLREPWIASFKSSGKIIACAVREALSVFVQVGPEVMTYKATPKDDSDTESIWINYALLDRIADAPEVTVISEVGHTKRVQLDMHGLAELFHLDRDEVERRGGFFLVRKGPEGFFVTYRFNDDPNAFIKRILWNAVARCYVLPSPLFVSDVRCKVAIVACPSIYSHVVAYVFSPGHDASAMTSAYVSAFRPEEKRELAERLAYGYDHLICYDRDGGNNDFVSYMTDRYYASLYGSKQSRTLVFVKDRNAARVCGSCHSDNSVSDSRYFECRSCGNVNSCDLNIAFSLWLKWCWGVTNLYSSGFVKSSLAN